MRCSDASAPLVLLWRCSGTWCCSGAALVPSGAALVLLLAGSTPGCAPAALSEYILPPSPKGISPRGSPQWMPQAGSPLRIASKIPLAGRTMLSFLGESHRGAPRVDPLHLLWVSPGGCPRGGLPLGDGLGGSPSSRRLLWVIHWGNPMPERLRDSLGQIPRGDSTGGSPGRIPVGDPLKGSPGGIPCVPLRDPLGGCIGGIPWGDPSVKSSSGGLWRYHDALDCLLEGRRY